MMSNMLICSCRPIFSQSEIEVVFFSVNRKLINRPFVKLTLREGIVRFSILEKSIALIKKGLVDRLI